MAFCVAIAERTFTLRSYRHIDLPNESALLQYSDSGGHIKGTFDITDGTTVQKVEHHSKSFVFRVTTTNATGGEAYTLLCSAADAEDMEAWIGVIRRAATATTRGSNLSSPNAASGGGSVMREHMDDHSAAGDGAGKRANRTNKGRCTTM